MGAGVSPVTRLGARLTAANHKRFADRIETVTVDPVFAWLPRAGLGQAAVAVP